MKDLPINPRTLLAATERGRRSIVIRTSDVEDATQDAIVGLLIRLAGARAPPNQPSQKIHAMRSLDYAQGLGHGLPTVWINLPDGPSNHFIPLILPLLIGLADLNEKSQDRANK
jgi:hypothetical protein